MIGKYFLYNRLVLTVSHSEGELFSIAPIVEKVFARPHPMGYNGDFDLHCYKYSGTFRKEPLLCSEE